MNVLIINGHPDPESLETSFSIAYRDTAVFAADSVEGIEISSMKSQADSGKLEWEELEKARVKIQRADHIVWIHPARRSGFTDDTLAFVKMLFNQNKLRKGKTAHIITTMEKPGFKYRMFEGRSLINRMKEEVLRKSGIYSVKVSNFGYVANAKIEEQWELIRKASVLGRE